MSHRANRSRKLTSGGSLNPALLSLVPIFPLGSPPACLLPVPPGDCSDPHPVPPTPETLVLSPTLYLQSPLAAEICPETKENVPLAAGRGPEVIQCPAEGHPSGSRHWLGGDGQQRRCAWTMSWREKVQPHLSHTHGRGQEARSPFQPGPRTSAPPTPYSRHKHVVKEQS